MSEPVTLSVLGLSGSGKTTFLAALWDALSRPSEERRPLELARLPEERVYLNSIHERWLRCEPMPKTRTGAGVRQTHLELQTDDDSRFTLQVPDIPGEAFGELWEERAWTDDIRDASSTAQALAVFIHTTNIVPAHPLVALLSANNFRALDESEEEDHDPPFSWNPKDSPTQVKLIDLLQAVYEVSSRRTALPLAIVLSAWDLVASENVSPAAYMASQLPMLEQFLQANTTRFPRHVFGVSAQGGDVTDKTEAERLREIEPASDRVTVVEDSLVGHDITRPLQWMLTSTAAPPLGQ